MINMFIRKIEFDRSVFFAYLRFFVGGYFIYASIDKIIDPYDFARMMNDADKVSSSGFAKEMIKRM